MARLGRPAETVRGWLRAARRNASSVQVVLRRLLVELDPLTGPVVVGGGVLAAVVDLAGWVQPAAVRRSGLGVSATSPWSLVGGSTAGRWLHPGLVVT